MISVMSHILRGIAMQQFIKENITPTQAYFFATQNNILNETELLDCKKAAREYVRATNFYDTNVIKTPCDEYFITTTTAFGCIFLDDELEDVQPVQSFMSPLTLAPYYESEAMAYVSKTFLYSLENKQAYINDIKEISKPYLEQRTAKYNQFSDGLIKYITDGILPGKKNEQSLIYTFHKLDKDEQDNLVARIKIKVQELQPRNNNGTLGTLFNSINSYVSGIESDQELMLKRAGNFVDDFKAQNTYQR